MSAREIPPAIQWHEGLLLSPHHFQQLSSRFDALLQYNLISIAPYYWGVRHFRIDPTALLAGTLRVIELEAVMPDCLVVSYDASGSEVLEVDLKKAFEERKGHGPLTVHLAVAARSEETGGRVFARYDSWEGDLVADENTGQDQIRIPRLKPRIVLLVTDDPPKKYVSFPLLKVQRTTEAFAVTDYISPTLMVPVQSPLGVMCSLVARRIREKAMYLSEQLRSPAANLALALEKRHFVHCLVASLPFYEAILYTGASHPYNLYLALCSLVGHVAALSPSRVPPVLPPYSHNDLRATFERAIHFVTRMINEGIPESYTGIPFKYENGIFHIQFEGAWAQKRLMVAIRASTGMTEKDVIAWGDECLIGSRRKRQSMLETRVRGAARSRIERDDELIPAPGVVLFSFKADPDFVEPNEVLEIFDKREQSGAPSPAEIILYVMNRP